jgi:hypothetical protein
MTNEVTYNLTEITGGVCNRNTPRDMKMDILSDVINFDRWSFLGFDANGSKVRLKPLFHNIRDKKGRFTRIKNRRK